MEFDDDAKSECTELPVEYKPSLFTNSALSQSNILYYRFIPDDMEFDDDAKSECTELPVEYKPSLFTNSALSV